MKNTEEFSGQNVRRLGQWAKKRRQNNGSWQKTKRGDNRVRSNDISKNSRQGGDIRHPQPSFGGGGVSLLSDVINYMMCAFTKQNPNPGITGHMPGWLSILQLFCLSVSVLFLLDVNVWLFAQCIMMHISSLCTSSSENGDTLDFDFFLASCCEHWA